MVIKIGICAAETIFARTLLEGLTEFLDGFLTCAHAFQRLHARCCECAALNRFGWTATKAGW